MPKYAVAFYEFVDRHILEVTSDVVGIRLRNWVRVKSVRVIRQKVLKKSKYAHLPHTFINQYCISLLEEVTLVFKKPKSAIFTVTCWMLNIIFAEAFKSCTFSERMCVIAVDLSYIT